MVVVGVVVMVVVPAGGVVGAGPGVEKVTGALVVVVMVMVGPDPSVTADGTERGSELDVSVSPIGGGSG